MARAILQYGKTLFPVICPETGSIVEHRRLIRQSPKILLKSSNSILSIKFKFFCFRSSCIDCAKGKTKQDLRKKFGDTNNHPPSCVYNRTVCLYDSYNITNASLDTLVKDLADVCVATGIPLNEKFISSSHFALSLNIPSLEDQSRLITRKLRMPFHLFSSVENLKNCQSIPPKECFTSLLTNDPRTISDEDYNHFCWVWTKLCCRSLLDLVLHYVQFDSAQLADAMLYHATELFSVTNLWCGNYVTLTQLSLSSAMLDSRDPEDLTRPLQLEAIDEITDIFYSKALIGGFSTVNAHYLHLTNGLVPPWGLRDQDGALAESPHSTALFTDANQLYSSCLQLRLPYSEHTIFDETRNHADFAFYSKKIFSGDSAYFARQATCNNYSFFVEIAIGYDAKDAKVFGLDMGSFPTKRSVTPDELSLYQRETYATSKRKCPATARLVSTCEKQQTIYEFVDNVILMMLMLGAFPIKIFTIVRSRSYDFFADYVKDLSAARGAAKSPVFSKIIKSLSNRYELQVQHYHHFPYFISAKLIQS